MPDRKLYWGRTPGSAKSNVPGKFYHFSVSDGNFIPVVTLCGNFYGTGVFVHPTDKLVQEESAYCKICLRMARRSNMELVGQVTV